MTGSLSGRLAISLLLACAAAAAPADALLAQDAGELRGLRMVVEPYAGDLDFDGPEMPRQRVAGLRLGVDLQRVFGLYGTYWRGFATGFDRVEPVEAWGGETRLGAPLPAGITPFVTLGGALVRFGEDHPGSVGTGWTDRLALIPGAGLSVELGERWRIGVGARDHIVVDSISDFRGEELSHNWLYSAGLSYRFGGRRARAVVPERVVVAPAPTRPAEVRVDTVIVAGEVREVPRGVTDYQGERMVTIPIPLEGEITLRYGPGEAARRPVTAPGTDEALLRRMIREELGFATPAEAPAPAQAPADLEARIARLLEAEREMVRRIIREELQREAAARAEFERRLLDRVEDVVARRMAREAERYTPARPRAAPTPRTAEAPRERRRWVPREAMGYTGANFVHPGQFLLGTRADLGSIGRTPLRIVPELAAGFGAGTSSIMLALNAQYRFPALPIPRTTGIAPHVGLGGGYLRFTSEVRDRPRQEGVINLGYGASMVVPRQRGWLASAPDEVFIEHQGIDFYDLQRLLLGARWRF